MRRRRWLETRALVTKFLFRDCTLHINNNCIIMWPYLTYLVISVTVLQEFALVNGAYFILKHVCQSAFHLQEVEKSSESAYHARFIIIYDMLYS